MRLFPLLIATSFLLPLLGIGGCTEPLNNRITFGGNFTSPSFLPNKSESTTQHAEPVLLGSIAKPRTTWSTTKYIAPFDGVAHLYELTIPLYSKRDDLPRIYGKYPTAMDAVELQATSWFTDVRYSISDLGRSFIGTPYALGYMTITGKIITPIESPHENWKRSASRPWSSGYPASNIKKDASHDQ